MPSFYGCTSSPTNLTPAFLRLTKTTPPPCANGMSSWHVSMGCLPDTFTLLPPPVPMGCRPGTVPMECLPGTCQWDVSPTQVSDMVA